MTAQPKQQNAWLPYLGMLALLLLVIVSGYAIFRIFATRVMPNLEAFNLLTLSIAAGIASFFSPCAFPLLPGYFSLYYAEVDNEALSKLSKVKLGIASACGVISFNLILGLIIAVLGTGVAQGLSITSDNPTFTRIFRSMVGIVLIALGIAQLRELNLKPLIADALAWRTRPRRDSAKQNPTLSLYWYGFGYNAAGMGCTGPILAALIIFALGSGGFLSAMSAFAVFSVTMGSLMLLVSVLVATSQETIVNQLKDATPGIKKAASILLIAVGIFNIISSIETAAFVQLLFP